MFRCIWMLVIVSTSAFCQEVAEGTIVDSESGKPVPFASVGIIGSSKGTSSNLQGRFSISISAPVTLMISCIGYETKTISSSQLGTVIKLRPQVTQLNTVLVSSKETKPERIVRSALSRIRQNFSTKPFLQTYFYRHYCNDDGTYGRLVEASVDVWKSVGYKSPQSSAGQKESIRITQLRRSLDNTKGAEGHEPISLSDILETDIVGYQVPESMEHLSMYSNTSNLKADFNNYTFRENGITMYDGREVYEIRFEYKKDSAKTTTGTFVHYPRVEGTLYISLDDYAIVKTEQLRTLGKDSIQSTVYYREYDGRYYPYHYLLVGQDYNDAMGRHAFHIELVSVNISQGATAKFESRLPTKKDLLNIPYDSNFWTTATILKTTPLEDQIIKDLGGGQSLNEQFQTYHRYQLSIHDGGRDAEQKFEWLRDYSKGKWPMYIVFWNENFKSYLIEMEKAKMINKLYEGRVKFVFISVDDEEERWSQTIQNFNYFADGIINYRIGGKSKLAKEFKVYDLPHFILINRKGEIEDLNARRPSDSQLASDINRLIRNSLDQ